MEHNLTESSSNDADSDATPDGEFGVENILDKCIGQDGAVNYLVRWEHYGPEDDTWEPRSNLTHCDLMIEDFERRRLSEKNAETEVESTDEDSKMKPHPLRDGGFFKTMDEVLRKGKSFTPLPKRRQRQATCMNESYLLDKSVGGRLSDALEFSSSEQSNDDKNSFIASDFDDDNEKLMKVKNESRSVAKKRRLAQKIRRGKHQKRRRLVLSSSDSEEDSPSTDLNASSASNHSTNDEIEGWTAVVDVAKSLHVTLRRSSAEQPIVVDNNSTSTKSDFSAQLAVDQAFKKIIQPTDCENVKSHRESESTSSSSVLKESSLKSGSSKRKTDTFKRLSSAFAKTLHNTSKVVTTTTSEKKELSTPTSVRLTVDDIAKEFLEKLNLLENKKDENLLERLKSVADVLQKRINRLSSYIWPPDYGATQEDLNLIRRQRDEAILNKDVQKVNELLNQYRPFELGIKESFDCSAESLINKKRKLIDDHQAAKARRLNENGQKNPIDQTKTKQTNELLERLTMRRDVEKLAKIPKISSNGSTPTSVKQSPNDIPIRTEEHNEGKQVGLHEPSIKKYLKSDFIQTETNRGRWYWMAIGSGRKKEEMKKRMINYVSKCVDVYKCVATKEYLTNLTAKVSKSARQHHAVCFFGSIVNKDARFSKRLRHKCFTKHFDNDRIKVAAQDDERVSFDIFNKALAESMYEEEIENKQYNENIDSDVVAAKNIEAVFMFQADSPYGDICNIRRDMICRNVSKGFKDVSQSTPLARYIFACYEERGYPCKPLMYKKILHTMYEITNDFGPSEWSLCPPMPKDARPLPPPPPPPSFDIYFESPPSVVSDNATLPDSLNLSQGCETPRGAENLLIEQQTSSWKHIWSE